MYELMLYMYFKHTYRILEVFMEQNLSQYKIFYEVAKAGNISKAAKNFISASLPSARPSAN